MTRTLYPESSCLWIRARMPKGEPDISKSHLEGCNLQVHVWETDADMQASTLSAL